MIPSRPFYLIRHGETDDNVARITAGGGTESPLNDNGRAQARRVAETIAHLEQKPTKIIHSSMNRTTETATIINEALGVPMQKETALVEQMVGEWEGAHWDEVIPKLQADMRPEGGESRSDFAVRVKGAMNRLFTAPEHESEALMVVAHGGTFYALMNLYRWHYDGHIHNCQLHLFTPKDDHAAFPWEVCRFEPNESQMKRGIAEFCPRVIL
jgi:broad specificity phosphatase PhoE